MLWKFQGGIRQAYDQWKPINWRLTGREESSIIEHTN